MNEELSPSSPACGRRALPSARNGKGPPSGVAERFRLLSRVQQRSAARVEAGIGLAIPVHYWHYSLDSTLEHGNYCFNSSIGTCDLQTRCAAMFSGNSDFVVTTQKPTVFMRKRWVFLTFYTTKNSRTVDVPELECRI